MVPVTPTRALWAVADRVARTAAGYSSARAAVGWSLALAGIIEALVRAAISGATPESTLAYSLLAIGTTVPLALLGRLGAASISCAATVLSLAAFHTLTGAGFAVALITLYRLADADRPQPALAQPAALALSVPFIVLVLTGPSPATSEAATLTALLAALAPVASLGGVARQARAQAEENRAARQMIADTLIEHTARAAHHISMVAVQAEAARLAVEGMPPAGAQRLSAIGDTARAALVEMRRILGVLRPGSELDREGPERHPQPSLDQLNELIDGARSASGSAVRLILRGTPIALDPSVELVAYRIVQEALTNARRHAPAAAADVELRYTDDSLQLRIRDNGPGPDPAAANGGHGIAGMQERASAVGGRLRTGPALGGGYLVDAMLPAKIEQPA
jgi:signal transduction histidine kinase